MDYRSSTSREQVTIRDSEQILSDNNQEQSSTDTEEVITKKNKQASYMRNTEQQVNEDSEQNQENNLTEKLNIDQTSLSISNGQDTNIDFKQKGHEKTISNLTFMTTCMPENVNSETLRDNSKSQPLTLRESETIKDNEKTPGIHLGNYNQEQSLTAAEKVIAKKFNKASDLGSRVKFNNDSVKETKENLTEKRNIGQAQFSISNEQETNIDFKQKRSKKRTSNLRSTTNLLPDVSTETLADDPNSHICESAPSESKFSTFSRVIASKWISFKYLFLNIFSRIFCWTKNWNLRRNLEENLQEIELTRFPHLTDPDGSQISIEQEPQDSAVTSTCSIFKYISNYFNTYIWHPNEPNKNTDHQDVHHIITQSNKAVDQKCESISPYNPNYADIRDTSTLKRVIVNQSDEAVDSNKCESISPSNPNNADICDTITLKQVVVTKSDETVDSNKCESTSPSNPNNIDICATSTLKRVQHKCKPRSISTSSDANGSRSPTSNSYYADLSNTSFSNIKESMDTSEELFSYVFTSKINENGDLETRI